MREIKCPLVEASERWPEQPAIIDDDKIITYRELNQRVDVVVSRLQRDGIGEGVIVGILVENCLSYPILLFALWRLGAIACPVSTRIPEESIAQMLEGIGCELLVTTSNRSSDGSLTSVRQFDLNRLTSGDLSGGHISDISVMMDIDRDATVVFTSGSTSEPKAVVHSYSNHFYSALGSNENIRVLPGDRWLLSLPLYHVGGLAILFRAMLGGGAVVFSSEEGMLNQNIERFQITHVSLVASQLRKLLQDDLSSGAAEWLKAILVGGQAVPKNMISEAVNRRWPIFTTYGLTEMASQVTTSASGDSVEKLTTSGRLLSHRELKIADDGEILVRGETLFKRYLRTSGHEQHLDNDGWFHTGDIGSLDKDSYLTVTGRRDNMFISGGENIYPEEIESCLADIPEVLDAIVLPIKEEEYGCRPVAFLKLRPENDLDCADIIEYLKKHLPGFKVPFRFIHWPNTDDTGEMKPDRRRFQEMLEADDVVEIS